LVKKTNKVIILQEDSLFGGIASDISAMIMENCFKHLDAPVRRVGSLFGKCYSIHEIIRRQYLPKGRFEAEILDLLKY
jgi:2-oxoisovalerate dehydrogenase E1 component